MYPPSFTPRAWAPFLSSLHLRQFKQQIMTIVVKNDMVIFSRSEFQYDPTLPLGWYLPRDIYQVWKCIWPGCFDYEDEHITVCSLCCIRCEYFQHLAVTYPTLWGSHVTDKGFLFLNACSRGWRDRETFCTTIIVV